MYIFLYLSIGRGNVIALNIIKLLKDIIKVVVKNKVTLEISFILIEVKNLNHLIFVFKKIGFADVWVQGYLW